MVFREVFKGDYFGGRALIAENNMKNVKRQIQREKGLVYHEGVNAQTFVESKLQHERDKAAALQNQAQPPALNDIEKKQSSRAMTSMNMATPTTRASRQNNKNQTIPTSMSNYPSSFLSTTKGSPAYTKGILSQQSGRTSMH